MQSPEIEGAIALAAYRPRPDLLGAQIRSIAQQSLAHWQCHIGIDGTDNRAHELVVGLVDGDEGFVIHHYGENVGIYRNFERLVGERQTLVRPRQTVRKQLRTLAPVIDGLLEQTPAVEHWRTGSPGNLRAATS